MSKVLVCLLPRPPRQHVSIEMLISKLFMKWPRFGGRFLFTNRVTPKCNTLFTMGPWPQNWGRVPHEHKSVILEPSALGRSVRTACIQRSPNAKRWREPGHSEVSRQIIEKLPSSSVSNAFWPWLTTMGLQIERLAAPATQWSSCRQHWPKQRLDATSRGLQACPT